jgi:hypothetical protein
VRPSQVKDLREESIINRETIISTALVVVIVCLVPLYCILVVNAFCVLRLCTVKVGMSLANDRFARGKYY